MHDGAPVTHRGIAKYFSQHLIYSSAHRRYVVQVGDRCVPAVVEDQPGVAVSIDQTSRPWMLELIDGSVVEFRPETLCSRGEALYCRGGPALDLIRLRRTTALQLGACIDQNENGQFVFDDGESRHPIQSC